MIYVQDAYALCRVSKRNTITGPKIGEHYVSTTNRMACEHSSSIELYSDQGRGEEFESPNYHHPMHKIVDTCSTSYHSIGSPHRYVGESIRDHGKWTTPSIMDGLGYSSAPQFPSYATIPYPPSKVKQLIYRIELLG